MAASDRAYKLNAEAVAKLNGAIGLAQIDGGAPDLQQAAADVVAGKHVAALKEGFWSAYGWLVVLPLLLIAASVSKEAAGALVVLVILPWVGAMLSTVAAWFKSITTFPSAPKCEASGCGGDASYSIDPTGIQPIHLCYEHKTRVENRLRYAPFFRPAVAKAIVDAYQGLLKATRLDPRSPVIKENLKQARELAEIVLEQGLPSV